MTDIKKKLMTLLCEAHNISCCAKLFDDATYAQQLGKEADYLISNGVRLETEQATSDENKRWIPVSERLPDIVGCYLVVVKYKYDFEKEYNYDTDVATFEFGYDRKYIDGQWNTCVDWDEGQQYMHVTHWMPLPEPPKEDESVKC
jgi:hypothetical protein